MPISKRIHSLSINNPYVADNITSIIQQPEPTNGQLTMVGHDIGGIGTDAHGHGGIGFAQYNTNPNQTNFNQLYNENVNPYHTLINGHTNSNQNSHSNTNNSSSYPHQESISNNNYFHMNINNNFVMNHGRPNQHQNQHSADNHQQHRDAIVNGNGQHNHQQQQQSVIVQQSQPSGNEYMSLEEYNPELTQDENPFYYNKNKLLFDLHIERQRRNNSN